jgi:hypothetical protein
MVTEAGKKQIQLLDRVKKLNKIYVDDLNLIFDDMESMYPETSIAIMSFAAEHIEDMALLQRQMLLQYSEYMLKQMENKKDK